MSTRKKRIGSDVDLKGTLNVSNKITGNDGLNIKENNTSIIETEGNNIQIDKATIIGANFGVATGENGIAVTSAEGMSVIGNIVQSPNGAKAQLRDIEADTLVTTGNSNIQGDLNIQGVIKNEVIGENKPVKVQDDLTVTGGVTSSTLSTPNITDKGNRVILKDTTADAITGSICDTAPVTAGLIV